MPVARHAFRLVVNRHMCNDGRGGNVDNEYNNSNDLCRLGLTCSFTMSQESSIVLAVS